MIATQKLFVQLTNCLQGLMKWAIKSPYTNF